MADIARRPTQTPGRLISFEWYSAMRGSARGAFWSSFAGWSLDAYDYMIFSFAVTAIAATFGLTRGQTGLIATVTLVVSAFGGMAAGVLADRIGRVRTLMVTIAFYSVFTLLSGFAQSYEQLLFFRALQGLGFGGEWAAGAILVAELSDPVQRGRALGWIQSAWAIGWGLANLAFLIVFSLDHDKQAWRWLFWLGILPALLILYVRRTVKEPAVFQETRAAREKPEAGAERARRQPLAEIFSSGLLKTTLFASLLATGAQGGYYSFTTWLPTYLQTSRHLSVTGTGAFLFITIAGAFCGYIVSGYVNDWIGRRGTFAIYAVASAGMILLLTQLPADILRIVLPLVTFVLGFAASGIFSGFGSYLAELYPTRSRGAGQGFCYNSGRAVGALFPTAIGFLSASAGLSGAIAFGAGAYALCLVALLFLPETKGRELVAID
ncbi:MFS transporter [Candidatus Dormiibacter inghamiae]|uniref:MFS transporter n=1 Tax=Candidatus Dormiibacter inghamiae TaxID=3127013 RepID=UPI0030C69B31